MALTDLEKAAGRSFRDSWQHVLDALNRDRRAAGAASPLLRVVRHQCPKQAGRSVGITLAEHYHLSEEYLACSCGRVGLRSAEFPHADCAGAVSIAAAAGLFCFIWKDGRCPECGTVLRSVTGRVYRAADRPPEKERRVAGQA